MPAGLEFGPGSQGSHHLGHLGRLPWQQRLLLGDLHLLQLRHGGLGGRGDAMAGEAAPRVSYTWLPLSAQGSAGRRGHQDTHGASPPPRLHVQAAGKEGWWPMTQDTPSLPTGHPHGCPSTPTPWEPPLLSWMEIPGWGRSAALVSQALFRDHPTLPELGRDETCGS